MPENQHSFVVPDDQDIPALISLIQETFPVQVLADTVYHRVFYDTFDWRLHKHGAVLEVHDDGKSHRIYWRADKDGRLKIQLGVSKVPHLAADLPAGEFRRQLQPVIAVRELLARIKLRIKRQSFAVLDKNKKIVVRLNLDTYWYSPGKLHADRVLTRRLTIKAVKGYARDYQRVEDFFLSRQQPTQESTPLATPFPVPMQTAQDNVMKLALIASGVSTDDYTTRLILRLDPEIPAEQVFKEILLRLLEIMRQNTAGCIKGRDTEYMHDYRVAIRKIRVALKQLNQLDPQAVSTEYKDFFSMLGDLTTPVRDLDIFLHQLEQLKPDVETSVWQQLQPLRDYLLHSRAEAQKKFVAELKSSHYRETIKKWSDYLVQSETEKVDAGKPVREVSKLSDELLCAINQKTLQHGKAIAKNSNAEAMHELRKSFKKLRYLMEFFRGLYPAGKSLRELIQTLVDVQDDLGAFNDRHIQIAMVKAFIEQSNDKEAIKAAEQFIKNLAQQQLEAGKRFKDSYAVYASSASQDIVKEMFVDYYGRKK
jgi:CHAD domain-containing protein